MVPSTLFRVRDEKGKRESHLLSCPIARSSSSPDRLVLGNCGCSTVCCLGNSGQVLRELAIAVVAERATFLGVKWASRNFY